MRNGKPLLALLALVSLMVFAACGAAGSDGSADEGKGITTETGEAAQDASEKGRQAAEADGGRTDLPSEQVSLAVLNGKDEMTQRVAAHFKKAVKPLGWTQIPCDGAGKIKALQTCVEGQTRSNPAAIFTFGFDPSEIEGALKKLQDEDIPVINLGRPISENEFVTASYTVDEEAQGELLNDFLKDKLESVDSSTRNLATFGLPTGGWEQAEDRLKNRLDDLDPQYVEEFTTDISKKKKMEETTKKQVKEVLTDNSDIKAFYHYYGPAATITGKTLGEEGIKAKGFPEKPLVLAWNGDTTVLEGMRKGQIDAITDVAYEGTVWVGLDQLAQEVARNKELPPEPRPRYPITFLEPELITPEVIPPKGEYRKPEDDFVTFFETKWKEEFGEPEPE
ncbi:MAG: sugar ABC transporter substrate-binding protein [Solirubrobacterales bacterium]